MNEDMRGQLVSAGLSLLRVFAAAFITTLLVGEGGVKGALVAGGVAVATVLGNAFNPKDHRYGVGA